MKGYQEWLIDDAGNKRTNVTIEVRVANSTPGAGAKATIFSNAAGAAKANPFTNLADGSYSFFANDGRYDVVLNPGTVDQKIIAAVEVVDGLDLSQRAVRVPSGEAVVAVPPLAERTGDEDTVWAFDKDTGAAKALPVGSFPPGPQGPPGTNNTVATLEDLAALDTDLVSAIAAGATFIWKAGDYSGLVDGVDYVASDGVAATVGAWVRIGQEDLRKLGAFSGSTIADNQTPKQAMQALETAVETKATAAALGVAATAANLGTFTSPLIDDNTTAKAALESIGTNLAASGGPANIGYIASVAGAVARTSQAKMRDVISAADFGAVGDDSTNNATAFALIKTAAEAGAAIHFPRGTYRSSTGLLFQAPVRITADPGTRIKLTASADYVMRFDYDYDVGFFDHTGYAENLTLDGNGFAVDGLSLIGVISARFDNIYATNVTKAGLHLHWAQLCLFNDYICSGNIEAFTTVPENGILADELSSAANTFVNPTIEGVAGDGILGKGLVNTVFINGTSQGCGGVGMRLGETPAGVLSCIGNTVIGMDLEVNDGGDIALEESADANDFIGLKSGFATPSPGIRVKSGASRNLFHGGSTGDIVVDSGAVDTTLDYVSFLGSGEGLTNNGTRTKWTRLRNISDNIITVDSANPYQNEATQANGTTYSINAQFNQHHFIFATGATVTIANPTNPQAGQELTITISNISGGALAVTWGSSFLTNGIADPGNGGNRTYKFVYGANFGRWYLASMSPADVAN